MLKSKLRKVLTVVCMIMLVISGSKLTCFAVQNSSDCGAKLLALTFDDGPSRHTITLLDALKERNIKATFFIVGSRANAYFEIIERMYDEGHQIGSHTYSHTYLTELSTEKIKSEAALTETYLSASGDNSMRFIRAPGGLVNSRVIEALDSPMIMWSLDPLDWKYQDAERVKKEIVSKAKDGDIILVHDLFKTSVEGAIMAIDELLDEGYEFVTVNELLYRRGITPEKGKTYSSAPNTGINLPGRTDEGIYTEDLSQHWAYESIKRVVDSGVYKIPAGGEFAPEREITRGMFVTMLGRMAKADVLRIDDSGYSDVPADFYQAPYIVWARESGIMKGYGDGRFGIGDAITKEEMIACLVRYIDYLGLSLDSDHIPKYSDESQVSAWAEDSINFCKYAGILKGGEIENCGAKEPAKKGEAAEYLCRVYDYIESRNTAQSAMIELVFM